MPELVVLLLIFVALGSFFLFIHLLMGTLLRPQQPEDEKLTIYECGEPTVGTAWIQFDLRYYVVALLFIVFDVEVAFFFPWAVVFGKANTLADSSLPAAERAVVTQKLLPSAEQLPPVTGEAATTAMHHADAWFLALVGFGDILFFFGVLLVGFAYLWKRGDINWIRSVEDMTHPAQKTPPDTVSKPEKVLVS